MIKVHYFSRSGGLKKYFRPNSATLAIPTISITNGSTANVDEAATLQLSVSTSGVPTPTVTYESSNTSIATVNSSGLITGVAEGSCVITATATNSQGSASDTLNLTVQAVVSALFWEDDFETNNLNSYYEYNDGGGSFVRTAGAGRNGGYGMVCTFAPTQDEGGNLKIAFGRTPDAYFAPVDAGTQDYREIYWRFWVKLDSNWQNNGGAKLTRATIFANSSWAQAMIGHVWTAGTGNAYLGADPARGTDVSGNLVTTTYNDNANLTWLGLETGTTPLYTTGLGQWHSVETHIKLNDAGQSNGIFEVWIDDVLEIQITDLNWVGAYDAYGINTIMLENFINNGAPQAQTITFDDFAISTERIYSGATNTAPTISITNGATADITDGDTLQLSVSTSGVPTPTVTYGSSNEAVATVSSTGLITSVTEGTCVITATATNSEGSASDTIDITVVASGGVVTPDINEDFSTYTSSANFISDPNNWYDRDESFPLPPDTMANDIVLDSTVTYNGNPYSMRYEDGSGAGQIGLMMSLPVNTKRVWVEWSHRWEPTATLEWGQGGDAAYKFLHVEQFGEPGRFGHGFRFGDDGASNLEPPDSAYEVPGNDAFRETNFSFRDVADGNWHTFKFYVDINSPSDNKYYFWWNDQLRASATGFSTLADELWGVAFGRNYNQVPETYMPQWWGHMKVWHGANDPGWILSAGTITEGNHTDTVINATASAPTGGVGTYTYQWYNSADDSAISGQTSLTLSWTGRTAATQYGYYLIATCSDGQTVQYSTQTSTTDAASGEITPFWDQQWNYANSTEMRAAAEYVNPANLPTLGTEAVSTACPLGKYASTQYPGGTPGVEGDVNFDWAIPTGRREVWIEMWIRMTDWSNTSDDKSFFILNTAGGGTNRWEIHFGSGGTGVTYCQANNTSLEWIVPDVSVHDGQWHRVRLYLRMSSDVGTADGAFYWMVDDTVLLSDTVAGLSGGDGENVATANAAVDNFGYLRLGANADPQGTNPTRDWGRLQIYDQDPGWSWADYWGANLPTGMTEEVDINFESTFPTDGTYGDETQRWLGIGDGGYATVHASNDTLYGPGCCETTYAEGSLGNGGGGFKIEGRGISGVKRLYIEFDNWFSSGYVTHTNKEKIIYPIREEGVGSGPSINLEIPPGGTAGGPARFTMLTQVNDPPYISQPANGVYVQKGVNQHIECFLQMNTGANFDGIWRIWIDGELAVDYTDIQYSNTGNTDGFEVWRLDGTRGGGPSSVPVPTGGQRREWSRIRVYVSS